MVKSYKFSNKMEGLYKINVNDEDDVVSITYRTIFNYLRIFAIMIPILFLALTFVDFIVLKNMSISVGLAEIILFVLLWKSIKSSLMVKIVKKVKKDEKVVLGSMWLFKNPLTIDFKYPDIENKIVKNK